MTPKLIISVGALCLTCFFAACSKSARSSQIPQANPAQVQAPKLDTGNVSSFKAGYSLSATLPSNLLTPYQPLVLTVSLTNTSSATAPVYDVEPDINFLLVVNDAKGNSVPFTQYGEAAQKVEEAENFGFHVQPLHVSSLGPGQTKTYTLLLSRIYDFSICGVYTIRVHKHVKSDSNGAFVDIVSNPVTVTISEPSPPQDQGVD